MDKYEQHIYCQPQDDIDEITTDDVVAAFAKAKKTAAGMDNWQSGELALMSRETRAWVATMYRIVEETGKWPDGVKHARAAYLAKNCEASDDPMQYRVLINDHVDDLPQVGLNPIETSPAMDGWMGT